MKAAPARASAAPLPVAMQQAFTPEPQLAVGEPALTKLEPAVRRAKERAGRTPSLGTYAAAQSSRADEGDETERSPRVLLPDDDDMAAVSGASDAGASLELGPQEAQSDPEPSRIPDVLTAMLELHTGVAADEAPTRLRGVVTEARSELAEWRGGALPGAALPAARYTPEPQQVDDAWLTRSSLEAAARVAPTSSPHAAPNVHEALTWKPAPVVALASAQGAGSSPAPQPLPEPSPYAPAVLAAPSSSVAELLETFDVSAALEERALRSALKEMAGLDLSPAPQTYIEKR